MKKYYNKLVRDKIVEIIAANNQLCVAETLEGEEFIRALKEKLVEEARELERASDLDAIIEELADIYEVISTLISGLKITEEQILAKQLEKRAEKGGFRQQICLKWVE